jgi:hypothetical protein
MLHLLFECQRARQVWDHLGLEQIIDSACAIDRVGHAVLEYILYNELHVMRFFGTASIPELVAITAWYLWWERCKAIERRCSTGPGENSNSSVICFQLLQGVTLFRFFDLLNITVLLCDSISAPPPERPPRVHAGARGRSMPVYSIRAGERRRNLP